jgi:DNA-binding CsgD family transcriptional regulator
MIGAIGEASFPSVVAQQLQRLTRFDLAAVILHRSARGSDVIFDDFDTVGCRSAVQTYARSTHRINPMLSAARRDVVRARDFARNPVAISRSRHFDVVRDSQEELGYRTVGWPQNHEEIGLYFEGWGGVIELGLYRERSRAIASSHVLGALRNIRGPIAAAFERHRKFVGANPSGGWSDALSSREREICDLLLQGCSSDAVALRLRISRHTVKDHRKNIFRKLQIVSLAELFARAR